MPDDIRVEIERVWDEHKITRIPGHDMSNECRLAAVILGLEDEGRSYRRALDSASRSPIDQTTTNGMVAARDRAIAALAKERDDARAEVRRLGDELAIKMAALSERTNEREQASNRESMALDLVGEMKTLLYIALDALRTIRDEIRSDTPAFQIRDAADAILKKPAFAEHIDASRNPCTRIQVSSAPGPGEHRRG